MEENGEAGKGISDKKNNWPVTQRLCGESGVGEKNLQEWKRRLNIDR